MATQTPGKNVVNGVDVDQFLATVEAIKGTPDIARFQFRLRNRWIDGGNNHTTIADFYGAQGNQQHEKPFELIADEHQMLLGEDKGPNPVEYLLTGLVACLTSSLVYHGAAKGIKIKGIQSRVEGDLDLRGFLGLSPDVKVGFQHIRVNFTIDADVSDKQKQELIEMAKKYSPVFNTVFHPTSVDVTLER